MDISHEKGIEVIIGAFGHAKEVIMDYLKERDVKINWICMS